MFLNAFEEIQMTESDVNKFLGSAYDEIYAEGLAKGKTYGYTGIYAESFARGYVKGYAEGYAKGIAEGRKEMAIDIAREMKQNGLGTNYIAKMTGLSEQKILEL